VETDQKTVDLNNEDILRLFQYKSRMCINCTLTALKSESFLKLVLKITVQSFIGRNRKPVFICAWQVHLNQESYEKRS